MAHVVGGATPARYAEMRLNDTYTPPSTAEIEEPSSDDHSYTITSGEVGGHEHPNANFGCPRCDRELNPGPWSSWICWRCGDVIYVGGGD